MVLEIKLKIPTFWSTLVATVPEKIWRTEVAGTRGRPPTRGEASRHARSARPHAGKLVGNRGRCAHTRGNQSAREVGPSTRGEASRHARSARPHAGKVTGTRDRPVHTREQPPARERSIIDIFLRKQLNWRCIIQKIMICKKSEKSLVTFCPQ